MNFGVHMVSCADEHGLEILRLNVTHTGHITFTQTSSFKLKRVEGCGKHTVFRRVPYFPFQLSEWPQHLDFCQTRYSIYARTQRLGSNP